MSEFRRIRGNLWHESASRLRKMQETAQCTCGPASRGGTSCSTELCINRSCLIECDHACPCGDECQNQRIQRGFLPSIKVQKFPGSKGMGVTASQDIEAGTLVSEYVGEVISQGELARRMENEYRDMRHTYIMTYVKGLLLDATTKGGVGRYLNHSCAPNCETQYWMVKGYTKVGIFTKQAIKAGTELCYDYNLQWNGFARVRCECGAPSCVGWLGGRSAAQRAHETLHDSEDEAAEGAMYLDEGAEGATKVQQLSAGPTMPASLTVGSGSRRVRQGVMAEPLPEDKVNAVFHAYISATQRYDSPYDDLAGAPGSDVPVAVLHGWNADHEAIEQRWREQQAGVQQLLLGMQSIGHASARSRSGAFF